MVVSGIQAMEMDLLRGNALLGYSRVGAFLASLIYPRLAVISLHTIDWQNWNGPEP